MKQLEGFAIGTALIALVNNIVARDWGDTLDGFVVLGLFLAWSAQRRRADRLDYENRAYRRIIARHPSP